jgi:hypothetical protein
MIVAYCAQDLRRGHSVSQIGELVRKVQNWPPQFDLDIDMADPEVLLFYVGSDIFAAMGMDNKRSAPKVDLRPSYPPSPTMGDAQMGEPKQSSVAKELARHAADDGDRDRFRWRSRVSEEDIARLAARLNLLKKGIEAK